MPRAPLYAELPVEIVRAVERYAQRNGVSKAWALSVLLDDVLSVSYEPSPCPDDCANCQLAGVDYRGATREVCMSCGRQYPVIPP